ncbi:MAG: YkgJ family cysteine cluster protein [SAR324 cluster bacterium]|nr:YkgJ family cysteine cluster protein [SAR324 cluster bacterium]
MAKKTHRKSLFRFEMMEGSIAIQKQDLNRSSQGSSNRVAARKFLARFQGQAKVVDAADFPHQNRLLALGHSYCENVAQKAKEKLAEMGLNSACHSGCDACCYYAEMDATGLEFEEIVRYVRQAMPAAVRAELYHQVEETPDFTKHQHRPCPFLDRSKGNCGIYPVRPMGCRGLLATKVCRLDVEEDTGLETTVRLVQQAWQEMPIRAGLLMIAQEQIRKGKGHINLQQSSSEVLVQFKQLEAEKLKKLFSPDQFEE